MSIAEIPAEILYAAGGLIFFLLILLVFFRRRTGQKDKKDDSQVTISHRDELLAAGASTDSRTISRAIPIATSLIQKNPQPALKDAELTEAICHILYRGGQKSFCQDFMRRASKTYADQQWFIELQIELLTTQKQIDEKTLFKIQDLQKKYPDNDKLNLFLASYYDRKKTYKAANLKYFEKASACENDSARWLYAIARCQQNQGNLNAAMETTNRLMAKDSGFPGAHDLKRLLEEQLNPKKQPSNNGSKAQSEDPGFAAERYTQISEMGRGGMGVVYKAFDEVLQRWVAIKTLQESIAISQPDLKQRFLGEARILAALDHPSIPKVFDLSLKPPYYLAFELINGESLRSYLEKSNGSLSIERFLSFAIDITSALAYADGKDILHRDIKPENILVTDEERCYVIDFGLAQIEGQTNLTKTGLVMGTPWYLAPERFRGEPATTSSEIYALGVMLFEMLEGCKPYDGNDINLVLVQEPKKVSRDDASLELQVMISECLSKNPANRPENFDEILTVLKQIFENVNSDRKNKDESNIQGT